MNGALAGFSTTRRSRAPSWPGGAQPRGSKSPIACIESAITGQDPDEGGSTQDALILVLALPMLNSAGRARSVVDAFNDAHVALRRIA